jgi:hypothetical protein
MLASAKEQDNRAGNDSSLCVFLERQKSLGVWQPLSSCLIPAIVAMSVLIELRVPTSFGLAAYQSC